MVGISEFMGVEIGEVLRVILPQAETVVDEGQDMFSLWTADEKIAFIAPFSGTIDDSDGSQPSLWIDAGYIPCPHSCAGFLHDVLPDGTVFRLRRKQRH